MNIQNSIKIDGRSREARALRKTYKAQMRSESQMRPVFAPYAEPCKTALQPFEVDIVADANQFRPLCEALKLMIDATDKKFKGSLDEARSTAIRILARAEENNRRNVV